MEKTIRLRLMIFALLMLFMLLVGLLGKAQAAPAAVTDELPATADAGTVETVPTASAPNAYLVLNARPGGFYDHNFINFDLSVLPADATIDSAELFLYVNAFGGPPLDVELGRVEADWEEMTLNWNNQPAVTWNGPTATVSGVGDVSWTVTGLLQSLQSSGSPFYGFALRGTNSNGAGVRADSKEWGVSPKLVVTYTVPPPTGARPDLGDAPDSSNHLGLNNTAYLAGAIPGRFPTVWDVPAGQVAGPRHDNLTGEGILGMNLSKEIEADQGADEDGINNILDGGLDNADNDRADDGWRNRNIKFFDCRQQTLTIRVSRGNNPTLNRMYLNVWFDGNRDGDWQDIAPCPDPNGGPAQASYEWIVQDHIVDMTAIPPGGFLDIQVDTERVLNSTPNQRHWMRFTLSEERAVQPPNGAFPDGRGPHPTSTQHSYRFGETEDIFQTPPPPGEDGVLVLEKRVLTNSDPVDYPGVATYQIRLRHDGGSQPIAAEIRDELDYPQHVLPRISGSSVVYVEVTSPTGGASPLTANLDYNTTGSFVNQVVSWEGTLEPNAEVLLTFDVHIHPICGPLQQTKTITNVAEARQVDGDRITAEASFEAACPGYDSSAISIDFENAQQNPLDLNELQSIDLKGKLTNLSAYTLTLGVRTITTGTLPLNLPPGERVILSPGEVRSLNFPIDLEQLAGDELNLPDELNFQTKLVACLVVDGPYTFNGQEPVCPDAQQYPNLFVESEELVIQVRPRDLGDAPDSSNHFGVGMAAYPGRPAAFPTVFDPATGLPQGPAHSRPGPFHLGPNVSREAEADIGPDQDPVNNIQPPANVPDTDRFDDGANPNSWVLTDCQTATVPVRVLITPQAVNWFQLQNDKNGYLNVWLDGNRDGDWADGTGCGAVEHIVIDFPVDVTALGAGLHVLNVPTGRVPWPAAYAQQPTWVRVSLSERKSNKTLLFGGISYGDGRGHASPFKTGETEDYHAYPQGVPGGGPDLAVWLAGEARRSGDPVVRDRVRFMIDYANEGSRPAEGGRLTFDIPLALRGIDPDVVQAPGIPAGDIQTGSEAITINLPDLDPGESGKVVLGWVTGPLGGSPPANYPAGVEALVNGELDPSDNEAAVVITPTLAAPLLGMKVDGTDLWSTADTTCRSEVELGGRALPGQTIDLSVDGQPAGSFPVDAAGIYTLTLQNLADGRHLIEAFYQGAWAGAGASARLRVDTGLPVDPLSLVFTDSQGRSFHPSTLNWSSQIGAVGQFLRPGETYEIAIDSCSDAFNQQISWQGSLGGALIAVSLRDDDGDGRYVGSFDYDLSGAAGRAARQMALLRQEAAAVDPFSLVVGSGGASQRYSVQVQAQDSGVVRDALTGQPLSGAAVTALSSGMANTPWPGAAVGGANPLATGSDGAYGFSAPAGSARVAVERSGYQPYHSADLAAAGGLLAPDIDLTPEISGAPVVTITISATGFYPAVTQVAPESVIAWVNADLSERGAAGSSWDSGLLAAGRSYRTRLTAPGSYLYSDPADPSHTAAVTVVSGLRIYLPLIVR